MNAGWLVIFSLSVAYGSAATPADLEPIGDKPSPGAARLREQTRVMVETNAVSGSTDAMEPAPAKRWDWEADWKAWDGLHLMLSLQTRLGEQYAGVTNLHVIHLEETRMAAKIGGKFAIDAAVYQTGSDFDEFQNGAELRRARIFAKGDCLLMLPVSYQVEIGYVPDQFYIEESYLTFKPIPWIGELRLGQYQAPMGLDVVTSTRDISFMEPAAPMMALAPGVNAGTQIGRPVFGERASWALGVFADGVGSDFGDASKDYGRAIARFTGLPIYRPNPDQPGCATLLHLGLSANALYSGQGAVRYQARPESHLAPYVVDTGDIEAHTATVVGAEAAWINGPLSVQGEYLHSFVQQSSGGNLDFGGFYTSVSWFLTGETRRYNLSDGTFARVIPRHEFDFGNGGWGAWELVGRASYVDLEDGDVHGGRLLMAMGGVNWHLHSHVKWRFNYGFGHSEGRHPEGNLHVFQTRVEVDF